mgnify:CR=1 FL=1
MKLTKSKLKQIIKEEIDKLKENPEGRQKYGSWRGQDPEGITRGDTVFFNGIEAIYQDVSSWDPSVAIVLLPNGEKEVAPMDALSKEKS